MEFGTGRAVAAPRRAKPSGVWPRLLLAIKVLERAVPGLKIVGYVTQVHEIAAVVDRSTMTREKVEANAVRCPDAEAAGRMIALIEKTAKDGDSLGGIVECVVRNPPVGLGEPVFDKLEADLAKAMLSLPASKGFEIGSGFGAIAMRGSEHNDAFKMEGGRVRTESNFSGGVQGGISNGEDIYFRVAFKPTSTIAREQQTVTSSGEATTLTGRGRHDPCVLPRAVPMVEAMAALVLCDHLLRQLALTSVTSSKDNPNQ